MYFINNDGKYFQQSNIPEASTSLDAGVYILKFHEKYLQFYLEPYDSFKITNKVYGDLDYMMEDILRAYSTRDVSTGISLQGFLGSGKTMLAKKIANKFVEDGGVVILVNNSYIGVDFYQFLQNINQDHMILFEEFDKVYSRKEEIDSLLTLFDGVFSKRRLIVLTANEELPNFFNQRPSRILYKYIFKSISNDIIAEVCRDFDVEAIAKTIMILNSVYKFNFDSLFALIEEYKRNARDVRDIITYLNIIPTKLVGDNYEVIKSKITFTSEDSEPMTIDVRDSFFSVDKFTCMVSTEEEKFFRSLAFSLKNIVDVDEESMTFEREFEFLKDIYDEDTDECIKTVKYTGIANIKIAHKPLELVVSGVI